MYNIEKAVPVTNLNIPFEKMLQRPLIKIIPLCSGIAINNVPIGTFFMFWKVFIIRLPCKAVEVFVIIIKLILSNRKKQNRKKYIIILIELFLNGRNCAQESRVYSETFHASSCINFCYTTWHWLQISQDVPLLSKWSSCINFCYTTWHWLHQ